MIASRASRLAYDVGVAGQSVKGALDQLVTAVSGEILAAGCPWGGAGLLMGAVGAPASHGSVAGEKLV